jgi:predicted DNA-binding protein
MPNKKPVTFHLTVDQHARLKALSGRTGLTVAEMIRRAVDAYLERDERNRAKKGEK